MGAFSGKFGTVNTVPAVRQWQISDTITLPEYVASNTLRGKGRKSGISDWSGSYQAYGGQPAVMPGTSFSFAGYTAPENETLAGTGVVKSGTAVVSSVAIVWDFAANNVISHTVNFEGNSALSSNPAGSPYDDAADPVVYTPGECPAIVDEDTDEVTHVTTATLTISSSNPSYANSSTSQGQRRKSGIIDFTLSITREDSTFFYSKGADVELNLYVTPTLFWVLKWAKVQDYTNFVINPETGAIISHTMNFAMNGFKVGTGPGNIILPDTNLYWGVA